MAIFITWIALSLVAGAIANNKGRSAAAFFFVSLCLSPLIGILAALVSKSDPKTIEARHVKDGTMKRCPFCAELVKAEATICKHCRNTLTSLPAAGGTLPMAVGSPTATRSALGRVAPVVVGLGCAALAVAGYNSDVVLSALGVVGSVLAFALAW